MSRLEWSWLEPNLVASNIPLFCAWNLIISSFISFAIVSNLPFAYALSAFSCITKPNINRTMTIPKNNKEKCIAISTSSYSRSASTKFSDRVNLTLFLQINIYGCDKLPINDESKIFRNWISFSEKYLHTLLFSICFRGSTMVKRCWKKCLILTMVKFREYQMVWSDLRVQQKLCIYHVVKQNKNSQLKILLVFQIN